MVFGGRGAGGNRSLDDKGVNDEMEGSNFGVCCREADLQDLYRRGGDIGIQ